MRVYYQVVYHSNNRWNTHFNMDYSSLEEAMEIAILYKKEGHHVRVFKFAPTQVYDSENDNVPN